MVKQYRQKVPGRPSTSDFEVHIQLTFDVNGGRETLTQLAPLGHMTSKKLGIFCVLCLFNVLFIIREAMFLRKFLFFRICNYLPFQR